MEAYSQGQNDGGAGEGGGQYDRGFSSKGDGKDSKKEQKKYLVQHIYDAFFALMVELLKSKRVGEKEACVVIVIMFLQVNAILFDNSIFSWNDYYLQAYTYQIANYLHIHDAIDASGNEIYYYILFYVAFVYQIILTSLFVYLHFALKYPQIYVRGLVNLLQFMLLFQFALLFIPFNDHLTSIFNCNHDTGYHYLLVDVKCYQTQHIVMMIIAVFSYTLFILANLMCATLYNETQPVKENALARLDSNFEWIMLGYRATMSIITIFCYEGFCQWIVIVISLLSSSYFLYQYFKFLPYYNTAVSIVFGAMLGVYFWISLNALLMVLWGVHGQIIVILLGVPVVLYVMQTLRERKIEWLMSTPLDKFGNDIDCLNQIMTMQEWLEESQKTNSDASKEIKVKGFINQHMKDCTNTSCVCQRISELYDHQNDTYLSLAQFGLVLDEAQKEEDDDIRSMPSWQKNNKSGSLKVTPRTYSYLDREKDRKREKEQQQTQGITEELHKNEVFLNNFNRQLYIDALQKFVNSVSINILFSYYYFMVLKNIHAALHELKIAHKKRPNIYQQFTIFRYQNMIEIAVKSEKDKHGGVYEQLTNVKEFERLYTEMQKKIERVCTHQVEFWTHLATVIPDLNYLNQLNNQIVEGAEEAEKHWNNLCKINPDYPQGLLMYAEYQSLIRNNQELGKQFYDKAEKLNFSAKGGDNQQASDVLFSEEAVIVHISGNKEQSGKIVKSSQGLKKCFGWDRSEIMGQNVSILMPFIFARKHNQFLDQFYITARKQMFNRERSLFASHKTGYCFSVHVLIRQMPSLTEGIQYVGMIKPQITDNDYIITDMNGVIDSFTSGIGLMFNINPQILKEINAFNIQFIAPELMLLFNTKLESVSQDFDGNYQSNTFKQTYGLGRQKTVGQQRILDNSRFSLPGGDNLNFFIPQNFLSIIRSEHNVTKNRGGKSGSGKVVEGQSLNNLNSGTMALLPGQNNGKQSSAQFREFLKYISRIGKSNQTRRIPDLKSLLQCREYMQFDIKKSLQVEIREWVIPLRNSEAKGLRMLLFIIPKNQVDKRPMDQQSFNETEKQINNGTNSVAGYENNVRQSGISQEQKARIEGQQNQLQSQGTHVGMHQSSQHHHPYNKQRTNKVHGRSGRPMHIAGSSGPITGNLNSIPRNPSTFQQQAQGNILNNRPTNINQMKPVISFSDGGGGISPVAQPMYKNPMVPTIHTIHPHAFGQFKANNADNIIPASNSLVVSARDNTKESNSLKLLDLHEQSMQGSKRLAADQANEKLIDLELLKFERQETDEDEDDDQDQLDTERIDVKRDIALNDDMKQSQQSDTPPMVMAESRTDAIAQNQQLLQQLFQDPPQFDRPRPVDSGGDRMSKLPRPQQVRKSGRNDIHDPTPDILHSEEVFSMGALPHPRKNLTPTLPGTEQTDGAIDEYGEEDGEDMEEEYDEEYEDEEYMGIEDDDDDDQNVDEDEGEDVLAGKSQGSEEEYLMGKTSGGSKGADPHGSRVSRRSNRYKNSGSGYIQQQQVQQQMPPQQETPGKWNIPQANSHHTDHNNMSQNQILGQPQQRKKKDYARIVTNPKYKYFDEETCGSAYFNDWNASEKELDIRESIKRVQANAYMMLQTRKKRKAKAAAKDAEASKDGSGAKGENTATTHGDDGTAAGTTNPDGSVKRGNTKRRRRRAAKDADSKSKSQSRRSGESFGEDELLEEEDDDEVEINAALKTDGGAQIETQNTRKIATKAGGAKKDDHHNNTYADEGEASSVASSIQSQTRTYYTLKLAIDEKFVPQQMKNLDVVANVVWVAILMLSIVYFIIQSTLFSQIQSYIQIIVNSEQRIDQLMMMNIKLTDMCLLNENILQVDPNSNLTSDQVVEGYLTQFLTSATALKDAQTTLSLQTASFDATSRAKINPTNVMLQYFDPSYNLIPLQNKGTSLSEYFTFNIWEAVLQIVVYAYSLADIPSAITHSNPQTLFIFINCMNSVLSAVQESTQAIVDQSNQAGQSNNQTFLILVLGVSGALILSMAFLLPVIRRAKNNKQEVFALLTHKKVEKCIEEQLKKCRWYITKYQQQQDAQQDYDDNHNDQRNNIEENTHMPGEKDSSKMHSSSDEKKEDYIQKVKKQRRKWKAMDNNFLSITLRFLLILMLIETFFLYNYFTSLSFLAEVQLLTNELRLVISRQPQLNFLMLLEKNLINSNGSGEFLFDSVYNVVNTTQIQQNDDYESLISLFQSNYYSHTSLYNQEFTSYMYQDICQQITSPNYTADQCEAFDGSILSRGVYSSVVEYWDQLLTVQDDFYGSQRANQDIATLLNSPILTEQQTMSEFFLTQAHSQLGVMLQADINSSFNSQQAQNQTVFVFFILYVILVYAIVWRLFMKGLLEELWRAKACLQVLPVEVCFRIEEIRSFVYRNSSGFAAATTS